MMNPKVFLYPVAALESCIYGMSSCHQGNRQNSSADSNIGGSFNLGSLRSLIFGLKALRQDTAVLWGTTEIALGWRLVAVKNLTPLPTLCILTAA